MRRGEPSASYARVSLTVTTATGVSFQGVPGASWYPGAGGMPGKNMTWDWTSGEVEAAEAGIREIGQGRALVSRVCAGWIVMIAARVHPDRYVRGGSGLVRRGITMGSCKGTISVHLKNFARWENGTRIGRKGFRLETNFQQRIWSRD